MPHLLSLNSYHYRRGGSDAVYFDHAALFEEAGWETTYFSMHHPRNLESASEEYFTNLVDYEYASSLPEKVLAAGRSIYNFDARSKAKRLVADKTFDIAHVHCVYHHLTPSVLPVLHEAGVPIFYTAHDLKLACPAYKMMSQGRVCEACKGGDYTNVVRNRCIKDSWAASAVVAAEAMLHRRLKSYEDTIARIVAPSRFYRQKLIEWGWAEDRVVYIPNFAKEVDPSFVSSHRDPILYFGRLSEEKGLTTLVEAAAASGVEVDLVGTGPEELALRELIERTDAPVRLLGRLDGDDLWTKVGRARAVVLPSEWYENAPMSALESMQLERPIIGADIGGIPEIVSDSGAGIIVPSGDREALSQALSQVAGMPQDELSEMGRAGAAYVRSQFSRDLYFERMRELYAPYLG